MLIKIKEVKTNMLSLNEEKLHGVNFDFDKYRQQG